MPFGLNFIPEYKDTTNFDNTVSSIWSSIKNIWSQLNVELKHHDTGGYGSLTTTPFPSHLSDIDAGITGSSSAEVLDTGYRDGDKIRCKTLNIKGSLVGGTATSRFNILVVKHYDNFLGNSPVFGDIYENASNPLIYDAQLRVQEHAPQYKILARRSIMLSGLQDSGNDKLFNIFIPFKKRVGSYIEWEGISKNSPSNGKIVMFTWVTNTTGSPSIYWTSRLTYIDN